MQAHRPHVFSPPSAEVSDRLRFALEVASKAEAFILTHYSTSGIRFQTKPDGSPVTVADTGAEELVRDLISRDWPRDGIVGEECGHAEGPSGFRWVIDPIDGTRSFVHGVPLFGTLLGLQARSDPTMPHPRAVDGWYNTAGVAAFPALGERMYASLGGGAWHERGGERTRARVSEVKALADSTVSTTSMQAMLGLGEMASGPGTREAYLRLNAQAKLSRGWSDCYGTLLVATGRIEAMIDPPMKLWDVSALEPIVLEAGGELTGWDGRPTDGSTGAIATNGHVHAALVKLFTD